MFSDDIIEQYLLSWSKLNVMPVFCNFNAKCTQLLFLFCPAFYDIMIQSGAFVLGNKIVLVCVGSARK